MSPGERPTSERPRRPERAARGRVTRRAALGGAALAGIGAGVDRLLGAGGERTGSPAAAARALPFHGAHQGGIATPPQAHLHFAAFDVTAGSRGELRALMRRWSAAAAALTAGRPYEPGPVRARRPPSDPGEALGLGPAGLTLTFGFGPSLFASGRFGLARRRPPALAALPPFPGEALDPASSDGDLCVQACADDPQVAFHAVHLLARLADGTARLRWAQLGFRGSPAGGRTSRNLLGFKDGTNNIRPGDGGAMDAFVWAQPGDGPAWMDGGSYLVARRVQIVFPTWDAMSLEEQERAIGRAKGSGAPLGARREHDPVDLRARTADGQPLIPLDAHVRVASPALNGGRRILRRGYAYAAGATPGAARAGGHELDGGLFFLAFSRDPRRQLVPLLRRLSTSDALTTFTVHTASALFACPPGARRGEYVGQALLA
jgi:deferrochelatase/peroxidase EfeB